MSSTPDKCEGCGVDLDQAKMSIDGVWLCSACEATCYEDVAPVQALRPAAPVVDEGVVGLLEAVLQRARDGEIQAVAVAAVTTGRHDATVFDFGAFGIAPLHLAVSRLNARILAVGEDS